MKVLGIDLEGLNVDLMNQGVNIKTDRVIEIGAVLWDWPSNAPVKILSELIDEPDRISMTDEVEELTGISEKNIIEFGLKGLEIKQILESLNKLIENADYLMAHNAKGYDTPMLEALFDRFSVPMIKKIWIDTNVDVEFPRKIKGRSMALLEHAHGFVNPFPHRAITDVLSMLKVASKYSLTRMVKLAESPRVNIVARLNAPNWKNPSEVDVFNKIKNKVSKARFSWNPKKKIWQKELHKILIDEGKVNYEFDWYIVGDN